MSYYNKYSYGYSLNKTIRQSQDMLSQSYQRAMSKLGAGYSKKPTQNLYESNYSYRNSTRFSNSRYKKSYSVIPTTSEEPNYQTNSSLINPASQKIKFEIKSPLRDNSNQNYYRSVYNKSSYNNDNDNNEFQMQPTSFFKEYEPRKDYLEKIEKENIERKQKISPERRKIEYSPNTQKYSHLATNSQNEGIFSPQSNKYSSPSKYYYLSLEIDSQENKKKMSPQFNSSSPSKEPYSYRYNASPQKYSYNYNTSPTSNKSTSGYQKASPSTYYSKLDYLSLSPQYNNVNSSPKNKLTTSEKPTTTFYPRQANKSQTINSSSQKVNNNLPTKTQTNRIPAENSYSQKVNNNLATKTQTNKIPTTNTSSQQTKTPISQTQANKITTEDSSSQQASKLPTKEPPMQTNNKQSVQLSIENSYISLPPSEKKLPVTATQPSTQNAPKFEENKNDSESNKKASSNETLKSQTEFLDQVEKSMKEDSKEDTNTLLVERLKQYNNLHSKSDSESPVKNLSSPNKTSSNNSFESPSSFKSTENNNYDDDNAADVDIEISFDENDSDFNEIKRSDDEYEDDFNEIKRPYDEYEDNLVNKTVRVDSNQFPKMLNLICTQEFFIKPKIKFMIESTIGLADKMTSDILKNVLIPE